MPYLHFKGKTFVQNHHIAVKYHQLVPNEELSLTDPIYGGTGFVYLHDNLIVQGGNLKKGTCGSFNCFELGPAIEMENILLGKSLPTYEVFARYIFYTATRNEFKSKVISSKAKANKRAEDLLSPKDYFIGETDVYKLYMLYEPNIDWLKKHADKLN